MIDWWTQHIRDDATTRRIRGQSEVLSVVLLLAITITGTGVIVLYGSSALDDAKQASELDSAEHAMTQLDSKVSLVGIGSSRTQSLSSGLDATTRVENDRGWMRVMVDPMNGTPTTVMNQTLGVVVYANGQTEIAYQGGGVWRQDGNGTTMVSPPEVHYRGMTLTLPLVVVSGERTLDDRLVIRQSGTPEPKFPVAKPGMHNPLTQAEVNLTVHSEYYRAWGRFFEQRTGGDVAYDHANQTMTARLVTPPNVPDVEQGVASTSSQRLVIEGGGGEVTFTDSYNSSNGNYTETNGTAGTVKTVGGVSMSGDAEIRGNLVSGGGEVEMSSQNTRIGGNLSYGGSLDLHQHANITGWIAANGSVAEIDPVGGMVAAKNESISENNDNNDTSLIAGNQLQDCASTCELTAGAYYLEELDIDGDEELVLNLSDGNIELAVSGPITIDGTVRVTNPADARVNVYMDAISFDVLNGANVSVPGEQSGKFRVYGPPGVEAEFKDSRFVGMLYAPNSRTQQGTIVVTSQADVYGALVGGKTTLKSGGVVHYDAALAQSAPLPNYQMAPHVTYIHITVSRVNITSP